MPQIEEQSQVENMPFRGMLIFFGINLFLLLVVAYAASILIIPLKGLTFDFYPHYVGGQAVWRGENPYDRHITEQIQLGMFGHLLPPYADQQNMAYPAYASILLGPVLSLQVEATISLWLALQFCAILWTPVIWLSILDWRPSLSFTMVLILGLLFVFRYPMDLFVLGQFSGTVLLAYSASLWLLKSGYTRTAGGAWCWRPFRRQ